jgi:CubicO group peptidase (beta-lactamase class C family)
MASTRTPGVAVAIVRGSDVVYADTLFQIGSLTKVFTAATILSLAAQGKVRLDVPIGNYVSGLNPLPSIRGRGRPRTRFFRRELHFHTRIPASPSPG